MARKKKTQPKIKNKAKATPKRKGSVRQKSGKKSNSTKRKQTSKPVKVSKGKKSSTPVKVSKYTKPSPAKNKTTGKHAKTKVKHKPIPRVKLKVTKVNTRKYFFKYFGKRLGYTSARQMSADDIAKIVFWYREKRAAGEKGYDYVTGKTIKEAVNELFKDKLDDADKNKKRKVPHYPKELLEPLQWFHAIHEYPDRLIPDTSDKIWFKSISIFGKGVYVQGGKEDTYDKYFQDFTSLCNSLCTDYEGDSDKTFYIVCDEPEINKAHKRWEMEITVIDTITGMDYFGDGRGDGVIIDTPVSRPPTTEPEKEDEAPVTPTAPPADKAIEEEKLRREKVISDDTINMNRLLKLKESLMADIKFLKDNGLPFDTEMTKFRDIQNQIEILGTKKEESIFTKIIQLKLF